MFCRFFILRPVLSIVISIIIVIAGGVAIWAAPVSQYPDITPPSITVTATFPGANSEAIANTVAAPLEDQISGVAHMIYMQSSSANASNSVTITVYFDIGTDINSVLSDVLNRINTAMPQLPTQVQQQGVVVRKSSPDLFLIVSFYTDGYPDLIFLSNYVYRYIYPQISQVNGVGSASVVGNRNFAMRVWLDPKKLAYYHFAAADVVAAIKEQNAPFAIGLMGIPPGDGSSQYQFMINTQGYLTDVKQFENIIVRATQTNNQIVRLKDIGRVSLDGNQYTSNIIKLERVPGSNKVKAVQSVALLLYLTPGANQLATKAAINKKMEQIDKHLPEGIKYYYHYDASVFVKASIKQVIDTFRDAFILVFIVIFLFIQNIRGTIIPILAIPVSIIGTFAGIYALGFSINTLTLFGVVLAIGIVVDDAIVVLENVERIMEEEKLDSVSASIKAMEEVASPVIAIVLVLNAVFIPVAFLGGFAGLLYQQFAVTIAISVFLSGIVALTLTPTLCAIFLKNSNPGAEPKAKFRFFVWFDSGFNFIKHKYLNIVEWLIDHTKVAYVLFSIIIILTIGLYRTIPTSLMPLEDLGYYYTNVVLPAASSLERTTKESVKLADYLNTMPETFRTLVIAGIDILDNRTNKTNAAFVVSTLKPWDERTKKSEQVDALINKANQYGYASKQANIFGFNSPPIRGLSTSGGVTFYLQTTTDVSIKQIHDDSVKLVNVLKSYPAVGYAAQFYDIAVPQLYVDLDRDKAKLYGVNIGDVFLTLQSVFGTYYVNYFQKWNDLWWVILQSDYKFRSTPDLLNTVYVRSSNNEMVPVGSMAKISFKTGPEVVTRYNDYLASQIIVNPKPGYTTGDVMSAITDATAKTLGETYIVQWFGPAYQQANTGSSSSLALIMGIVMVFLILAALYELWGLPFSVLMAIPFSLFGAAIMLLLSGRPNDIFFQVSLITLIGLSAKNAILIVEFALEAVKHNGMTPKDAALEGARLRFRPIVMTSLAFILGALPLALANGAGANSQHSVGTGIIGGMIGSTFLATLFIPLFFTTIMNLRERNKK